MSERVSKAELESWGEAAQGYLNGIAAGHYTMATAPLEIRLVLDLLDCRASVKELEVKIESRDEVLLAESMRADSAEARVKELEGALGRLQRMSSPMHTPEGTEYYECIRVAEIYLEIERVLRGEER